MSFRVVASEEELDRLQAPWQQLADAVGASLFSRFEFVRTAWAQFHGPGDRLAVLVGGDAQSPDVIAPFYIERQLRRGIPHRVLRFISAWEGDRPVVLAARQPAERWREMLRFLIEEFREWDAIDLFEQEVGGPEGAGWECLTHPGIYWEQAADATSHAISLQGSWDAYLAGLDRKVRANYRNRLKRASADGEPLVVEKITDADRIPHALARFVAIERAGWKPGQGLGLAKDERHQRFYEQLCAELARSGRVILYFLKLDATDAAGALLFAQGAVLCERHIAYDPRFSALSPGILLRTEILKEQMGGPFHTLDMLGLRGDPGGQRHKLDWATESSESVRFSGYRESGRLKPLLFAKRLRRLLSRGKRL